MISRRRTLTGLAAVGASAAATAGLSQFIIGAGSARAQENGETYSWRNAQIAGGGFVPGIVFNETEADLIYARTDIGGLYRWQESSQTWKPLLDWIGWDNWGWTGVVSVATDPVEPNRVYAAVGTYTNDWDPTNGAVLYSDDYGDTWGAAELPFKQGGNMPGRGMGERLAVDPGDNSVVYLGTPSGNGLWKSNDYGRTWAEVTAFPNPGNFVVVPGDDYQGDNQGVLWIEFDQAADATYVGVADPANPLYVSTDHGSTWAAVEGAAQIGTVDGYDNIPKQAAIDDVNGYMYIITSWDPGPYNGNPAEGARGGSVWRCELASGTWTEIHPGPNATDYAGFGFGGLTLDRQSPGTLMVSSVNAWWPDETTFRSTDSGESWTQSWTLNGYPTRVNAYTMDHDSVGWLDWGANPSAPEESPKYGWMIDTMAIDPHDSDRVMWGTGATIYGSTNLTAWDAGSTFTVTPMVHGLEETSVQDLASPPEGPALYSALGDIGGFVHTDLDVVPSAFFLAPTHGNTRSIDFAELNPSVVFRVGEADAPGIGISSNSGGSWWAGAAISGATGAGTVAITANAGAIVWAPAGTAPQRSTDYGSSWSAASGLPTGARVRSDRADANAVYGFAAGTFYYSANGGASFTASSFSGFPSSGEVRFAAVPGHAGHVWLAGGGADGTYGMWRSTDGGANWEVVAGFDAADTVGFGAAAEGQSYPAIYSSAARGGQRGIWRSVDTGASWTRINDDEHQWGWTGSAITGDPKVFGRVYVGTNGRGVIVGESSDYVPDPTETGSETPSEEPTESQSPTEPPTGDCGVVWSVSNTWPGGFQGNVALSNAGGAVSTGWTVTWTFAGDEQVTSLWGGEWTQSDKTVTVTDAGWNGSIASGASINIGFTASTSTAPIAVEAECELS
ncbi:cellulose binding domain-containing protein [Glycomyces buryatensis]|uniref:Xyloglucanase n=1 Tax=Glycomyces buryatensis TaxID=2570927 RepID=A0A4S8Q5Q9_9ACTN|nr:cellulose binding domain-containing protein [Glycomyces buryatensis]THV39488.1 xyloglucanase [Glycomyces buryatensis]